MSRAKRRYARLMATAERHAADPRRIARKALSEAVRTGRLQRPEVCERCGGSGPIEGHHADYSRPLDVEWLCVPCHTAEDPGRKRFGPGPRS